MMGQTSLQRALHILGGNREGSTTGIGIEACAALAVATVIHRCSLTDRSR